MPRVHNKHHDSAPKGAVYIGRGSLWGNPFRMRSEEDRARVIAKFECEILPTLDVSFLRGKDLVCFCYPKPCHGDSIFKKANSKFEDLF